MIPGTIDTEGAVSGQALVWNGSRFVPGYSGSATKAPFTFATLSPYLIQSLTAGQAITRATIILDQAFDDPAATIQLGTTLNPNLVFPAGIVYVTITGQYDNTEIEVIPFNDSLIMTISPGASTMGAGTLYYWIQ